MTRIKKFTFASLVAFALAAGGVAVSGGAEQFAGSKGEKPRAGRESASLQAAPDELPQVAGSKGDMAGAGRDSS